LQKQKTGTAARLTAKRRRRQKPRELMPFSPHRGATNTNRRPLMSESYTLPTKPEGIVATLRERFNSGKVSAMMGL
jgi:hypothetical protein